MKGLYIILALLVSSYSFSQCILDSTELCKAIENCGVSGGDPTDELQLLSTTEVSGVTTQIAISQGNTININHPNLSLIIDECTGIFENCSNRSGNKFIRTTSTTNQGWEYSDWSRVGVSTVTSPDCITDLQIVARLGDRYFQNDNSCIYSYYDTRLLLNGVAVITRVSENYDYECSFDNRLDIDLDNNATVTFHRDNVPANSVVEVEFRLRSLYTSMTNPSPFARIVWSGIRSEASFSFNPNEEVTDIALMQVEDDEYWLLKEFSELPFASAFSYGEGSAPEGSETYADISELNKAVDIAQKEIDEVIMSEISDLSESENPILSQLEFDIRDCLINHTLSTNKRFKAKDLRAYAVKFHGYSEEKAKETKETELIKQLQEFYK